MKADKKRNLAIAVLVAACVVGIIPSAIRAAGQSPQDGVDSSIQDTNEVLARSADEIEKQVMEFFDAFRAVEPWRETHVGTIIVTSADSVAILAQQLGNCGSPPGSPEYTRLKAALQRACVKGAGTFRYLADHREDILDSFSDDVAGPIGKQAQDIQKLQRQFSSRIEQQEHWYRDRIRSLDDQTLKSHASARLDAYRQVAAYERQLFSTVTGAVDSMLAGVRGLEGDVEMMLVEAELAAPLYQESARVLLLSDRIEGVLQQLANANYNVVYQALDESIEALRKALEDYQHRLNNEFLPKLKVAPTAT